LKTIGFDRRYVKAEGPYLFDEDGERYLDLLSGFGVFALGRNHPKVIKVLQDVLTAELPNLVQMDVSLLAGLLAERLLATVPDSLERVFFTNSGTEAVEAAIKFSRQATGRSKIVYCHNGYHGLTMGSLSATGDDYFRDGFAPFVPDFEAVPFDDLAALEHALAGNDVAAFIVEPIQGHGVWIPNDDYLPGAAELCRRHGTLLIADEVQTGIGRTGRFWAVEHWNVEPDLICAAKALSGGFVPVGAVACRGWILEKVFDCMDRAVVHGSTFGKNNLAMAAGLATLEVIKEEKLVENAARLGDRLLAELSPLAAEHELLKEVRGRGMMVALELAKPKTLSLKASWKMLETANKGLFCQMITVPLFTRHRILSQVAGHGMHVVKFIPPLTLTDDDCRWIVEAVSDVVADAHRVPSSLWDFGTTLARQAMRMKAGAR
ncbi:MAG: aspartate aminotransferase family protein, partial [Acidiferrobacterales bacterium]